MGPTTIIDQPIVRDALVSMGVPGAIIAVLLIVITVLATANALQWRHSNKVYGYRLQERDTLRDALNDSKNTLAEVLKGMQERNEITEELVEVVRAHTLAFQALRERIDYHYTNMQGDKQQAAMVSASIAESLRGLSATIATMNTDMRVATAEVQGSLNTIREAMQSLKAPQRRDR